VPDFLVIGYHGRKSEGNADRKLIMGKSSNVLIREMHIPCIIIKRALNPEKISYVITVDGTQRSRDSVNIFLLLVQANDALTILHVEEVDKSNESGLLDTKQFYEGVLKRINRSEGYVSLLSGDKSVIDCISEYVDQADPDFLCLSPSQSRTVDSVTETLLVRTNSNVILYKI
jgi:hypothetical protein